MNIFKYIASVALILSAILSIHAQPTDQNISTRESSEPTVRAYLTPDSIMIGDRSTIRIEVTKDIVQQVAFPVFQDGMLDSLYIEIFKEGEIDTLNRDGRTHTLSKEYIITCFDAGSYHMGHFPIMLADRNRIDTLMSLDTLSLYVKTYEIDTLTQTIVDVTGQLHTPLRFGEFSGYLLYGLLIAAILAAAIYYIRRRIIARRNRDVVEVVPPESAHLKAIKALEALSSQKLWQSGYHKRYYTTLTDIVRTYIEERFGVSALEKTTDEILDAMKDLVDKREHKRLIELLSTADYVKFAKHTPQGEQNDDNYNNAYYFIEDTKIVEQEPVVDQETLLSPPVENDKQ